MRPWQDEQHIEIAAPPDAIYRYLADFNSHVDWSAGVTRVDPPAGGRFVVGAEFTMAGAVPGETRTGRITALQAPMRIAWETTAERGLGQWEFLVIPVAGATTLVQRSTLHPRNLLLWLLRDRKRARRLSIDNRTSLSRIKAIIEASGDSQT